MNATHVIWRAGDSIAGNCLLWTPNCHISALIPHRQNFLFSPVRSILPGKFAYLDPIIARSQLLNRIPMSVSVRALPKERVRWRAVYSAGAILLSKSSTVTMVAQFHSTVSKPCTSYVSSLFFYIPIRHNNITWYGTCACNRQLEHVKLVCSNSMAMLKFMT